MQSFPSPMRHHRRTPSAHREIKETLNARSEYTNEDEAGPSQHRINQYVIKDEIGRGSYGAVYLANDQFGDEYAVKAFSKTRLRKRAQSEMLRHGPRRFPRAGFGAPNAPIVGLSEQRAKEANDALYLIREEVAIMKKLNHPNLVQLIEVLDDPEEDTLYMVIEMCKKGVVMKVGLGESATPYPEETCRHFFRDLILGIEYLHSQGVVHRDIKPENLLLTGDDVLKIVDFGVSQMFEKSDDMRTAKSAGSPAFLPPELCVKHGDVSGKAADIWSMGVSLYCLRYGRIPFERDLLPDIYDAIKNDTPKFPAEENPDFVDVMTRLLEKDPVKRIIMDELRDHPWVTKSGTDTLLSAEENCSEPVEAPNSLELNHAFTRRVSHLICVPTTPNIDSNLDSTAEFAARVLRERHAFLAGGGKTSLDRILLEARHDGLPLLSMINTDVGSPNTGGDGGPPALLLGIGTGGIVDDFSSPTAPGKDEHATPTSAAGGGNGGAAAPPAPSPAERGGNIVSDSPSVVDFNVYDRAYEEEIARIQRSASRRGQGRAAAGMVYGTRFSEQGRGGLAGALGGGGGGGLLGLGLQQPSRGWAGLVREAAAAASGDKKTGAAGRMGFADLVARAVEGAKEEKKKGTVEEGAGDGGSGQEKDEGKGRD